MITERSCPQLLDPDHWRSVWLTQPARLLLWVVFRVKNRKRFLLCLLNRAYYGTEREKIPIGPEDVVVMGGTRTILEAIKSSCIFFLSLQVRGVLFFLPIYFTRLTPPSHLIASRRQVRNVERPGRGDGDYCCQTRITKNPYYCSLFLRLGSNLVIYFSSSYSCRPPVRLSTLCDPSARLSLWTSGMPTGYVWHKVERKWREL